MRMLDKRKEIYFSLANLESQILDGWFSVGDSLEGVVVLSKLIVNTLSLYFPLERKHISNRTVSSADKPCWWRQSHLQQPQGPEPREPKRGSL